MRRAMRCEAVRLGRWKNPEFDRLFHRVPAIADIEFLIDVFEVVVDGVGRDEQLGCDLLVLQALRQHLQDVELSVGEIMVEFRAEFREFRGHIT